MFSQETMSPWFVLHRTSQVTMILLAVAMLFIPLLYTPDEADAGFWMIVIGAAGVAVAIYVAVDNRDKPCNNGCGDKVESPSETHYGTCSRCGDGVWLCPNLDHPHKTWCGSCGDRYWDCPGQSEAGEHATCS